MSEGWGMISKRFGWKGGDINGRVGATSRPIFEIRDGQSAKDQVWIVARSGLDDLDPLKPNKPPNPVQKP